MLAKKFGQLSFKSLENTRSTAWMTAAAMSHSALNTSSRGLKLHFALALAAPDFLRRMLTMRNARTTVNAPSY